MKKLILHILLFCLLPLPVLFLLATVVDKGLKKSRHYYYAEWNDIFNGQVNADMIISGSSRAWVQISPRILDSCLHVNSYNFGMDGAAFNIQYERIKLYLKHNKKPKYIIQEVGCTSTLINLNQLPNPWQFLPYISDTSILAITQSSNMPYSLAERYFPLFKYNNNFPLIKEGILSYYGKGVQSIKYKGYEPMDKVWDSSFYVFKTAYPKGKAFPLSATAVAQFREFLAYCKVNSIKVFMVYPPAFIESVYMITNRDEIMGMYSQFSKEFNVPLLNYMYDSMNYDRSNFYNSMHLNRHGSEKFTLKLAHDLRPYIREAAY